MGIRRFLLLVAISLALVPDAAVASGLSPSAAPSPKAAPSPWPQPFAVQVGAYRDPRMADYLRQALEGVGSVAVDRIPLEDGVSLYRVLVGRFTTVTEAEEFIVASQLRRLFPKLWIEPIASRLSNGPAAATSPGVQPPSASPVGAPSAPDPSGPESLLDPYTVSVKLHCEGGRRQGEYIARFRPEPGAFGGTGGAPPTLDVNLHWSCAADGTRDWSVRDLERNPSYFGVAPVAASGSLTASHASVGDVQRSLFAYGLQVSAFKSFGGAGPTFEYRLLNARYSGDGAFPSPVFDLDHRVLAGARLPFAHRFELEPQLGFAHSRFVRGSSAAEAGFARQLLPQIGGRARVRAIELSGRASLDLALGYRHLMGGGGSEVSSRSGSVVSGQLRMRHFSAGSWGSDWFFEYERINQAAEGPDVATAAAQALTQSETRFLFGVTVLGLW